MSFTKRSISVIVKLPVLCDASVGFQFFTCQRKELRSPFTRPTKTSEMIVDPTGPSRRPSWSETRLAKVVFAPDSVLEAISDWDAAGAAAAPPSGAARADCESAKRRSPEPGHWGRGFAMLSKGLSGPFPTRSSLSVDGCQRVKARTEKAPTA